MNSLSEPDDAELRSSFSGTLVGRGVKAFIGAVGEISLLALQWRSEGVATCALRERVRETRVLGRKPHMCLDTLRTSASGGRSRPPRIGTSARTCPLSGRML